MSEQTAPEIAARLEDSMPICEKAAVIVLRRQHVEIERLSAERDKSIVAAVAAEREACAAVCIAQADRLEGPSDACGIALVCAGLIRARTKP